MDRRFFSVLIITLLSSIMLTGCCIQHEFAPSTCTTASTCIKCGEVEGEPLGHTWVEATCETAKTCSTCGEIEGEALGHVPDKEANFQDESKCSVCGKLLESTFTAVYEEMNVPVSSNLVDQEIPYTTVCYEDNTLSTTGVMKVSDFEVIDGNDNLEKVDGYKWVKYSINLEFEDENAWKYGASWGFRLDDYYNSIVFDESIKEVDADDELAKYGACVGTINWHGEDFNQVVIMDDPDVKNSYSYEWKDKVLVVKLCKAIRVPEGYDGIVVSAINKKYESEIEYITDLKIQEKEDYASVRLPAAK